MSNDSGHDDSHQDSSDSYSDSELSDTAEDTATSAFQSKYEYDQDNTINIDKPSGSTTIIINNGQSPSASGSPTQSAAAATQAQHDKFPSDVAQGLLQSPVQPLINFPSTTVGNKKRSFNSDWYKKYKWLEYSIQKDAAFCYPCRFFPTTTRSVDTFTRTGFRDWKHATGQSGMLIKHDKSCNHKLSMLSWYEYTNNTKKGTTIANRLDSTRRIEIEKNRHYLKAIAEILLLCGTQDLALRGHHESQLSSNRGNFLEILQVVAKHDKIVEDRIMCGPRNATYTSAGIQNSILKILGDIVRNVVCNGVKEAEMFSLLVDETKDLSKKEQMAIVLRYVDSKGMLHEHFLTYVEAASVTAKSLTKYILDTLQTFHLDPKWIISQGYDGASVMSGHCSGVQQCIRNVAPNALYVQSYAHTLNLVLVDSVKMVLYATEFFSLLEAAYVFVSTTKAHAVFMQKQQELHQDKQPLRLQKLSDTRWACRYGAVNAICRTYDSLLATLEEIGDGSDHMKAVEAKGLYYQIASFLGHV